MKIALLFPGQAPRHLLSAVADTAADPRGRALLDRAAAAAQVPCSTLLERGGRALDRTEILQPVLTAVALHAARALFEAGLAPCAVAGHSLGELAAWSAAGAIARDDAVDLAAVRGRLMAREADRSPGGLLALLDGSPAAIERALAAGSPHGHLSIAAWNAPDEILLTGAPAALAAAARVVPSRAIPVAGAWHSPVMAGAVEELRDALRRAPRAALAHPLVANRDGRVAAEGSIPDLLAEQLTHPICWTRTLETLSALGITDFVTVGPGTVLRGLVRKCLGANTRVHGTEDAAERRRTVAALAGSSAAD
ncbi:MAG: ACP S-malonyltransferase [Byssovorax sp.]